MIGVYDYLLDYHKKYYTEKLKGKTEITKSSEDFGNTEFKDGLWVLSLKLKQEILLNNIHGVDIDAQAVEVTQLSLFLKMLEDENVSSTIPKQGALFSKVLPDLSKNIICGNSLIGFDIMGELFHDEELKKLNPMDYESKFPEIILRKGFDAIVGNPPYLSTKGIPVLEKNYFLRKYSTAVGQFDLYGLFIEKCVSLLSKDGILGYITSNTFLSNKDFIKLRKLLLDKTKITQIINFGETVFKDANLDVSILILENTFSKTNKMQIAISAYDFFNNRVHYLSQNYFMSEKDNYEFQINIKEEDASVLEKLFKTKNQLSHFLELPRGIELGSNSDKIITGEKQSYRKLLVGKNIKKYEVHFDNMYIKFENDKSVFKDERIYNVPKILIQRIRNLSLRTRIVAVLDNENFLTMNTLRFGIAREPFINLLPLLGILNSKLVNYIFLKKFFNKDIYAYQLERIPIPFTANAKSFQDQNILKLTALVAQMLESKKRLANAKTDGDINFLQNKCDSIDKQIDKLVYELYELSENEIRVVEGA